MYGNVSTLYLSDLSKLCIEDELYTQCLQYLVYSNSHSTQHDKKVLSTINQKIKSNCERSPKSKWCIPLPEIQHQKYKSLTDKTFQEETQILDLKCASGSLRHCFPVVPFLPSSHNNTELTQRKNYYLKLSCDKHNLAEACHNLGLNYASGVGLKKNLNTAFNYASKACDLGGDDGCYTKASHLFSIHKKYPEAISLLKSICNEKRKHPQACKDLGIMYKEGKRVEMNIVQSTKYFTDGCKTGYPVSCHLAAINMHEKFTRLNKNGIKTLFKKNCKHGFEPSCKALNNKKNAH